MSRHAEIVRDFGDGTYRFRLGLGQLRELEEKRNAAAPAIFMRVSTGSFWTEDMRETIRLGLIGGEDVTPVQALKLVQRYVDDRPLFEWMQLATEILHAALIGPPADADADKKKGKETEEQTSASTFAEPTATVQ
jgi:hypothetical protein